MIPIRINSTITGRGHGLRYDEEDAPKVDEQTQALYPAIDADEEAIRRSEALLAPEVIGIVGGVAPSGWRLEAGTIQIAPCAALAEAPQV